MGTSYMGPLLNAQDRLKCDRQQPCATCTRRGLSGSCRYVFSVRNGGSERVSPPETSMQDRIYQLENLVLSLAGNQNIEPQLPDPSGVPPAQKDTHMSQLGGSFGRMSLENDETKYVEASHWTAIVDRVCLTIRIRTAFGYRNRS